MKFASTTVNKGDSDRHLNSQMILLFKRIGKLRQPRVNLPICFSSVCTSYHVRSQVMLRVAGHMLWRQNKWKLYPKENLLDTHFPGTILSQIPLSNVISNLPLKSISVQWDFIADTEASSQVSRMCARHSISLLIRISDLLSNNAYTSL